MSANGRHPDAANHFTMIYDGHFAIPRPAPGQPPKFGEATNAQWKVAMWIYGAMWGERKLLPLSNAAIAAAIGWDVNVARKAGRKAIDRALRGRMVRGVWYPGLIANGWVNVGPGTRTCARTIGASEMLMACMNKKTKRNPNWLRYPISQNDDDDAGNLGQSSAYPHMGDNGANLGQSSAYPHMGDNLPPHGGQLTPTWGHGLRRDEIKSSSSLGLTVPPGGESGDDDDFAALPETPNVPEPPEAPTVPIPEAEADDVPEPQAGLADTVLAIVALLRTLFCEAVAERFARSVPRIGRQIKGRWDCYTAAVWKTSARKTPPEDVLGFIRSVAIDFVTNGIDPVAETIARRHAEQAAAAEAREAEARRRRDQPAEAEETIEQKIAGWVKLREHPSKGFRDMAARQLAAHGMNPDGSPS